MFSLIISIIIGIVSILYLIFKFVTGNQGFWKKQNVFYMEDGKIFKSIWDRLLFRLTFHEVDHLMYNAYKREKGESKIAGTIMFRHPILFVMDLDLVKHILVKDFDHFINRRGIEFSDPKFDAMLFNMVNQEWKDMRATMSPTFTTSKMKRMFGVFNESSEKMAQFLKEKVKNSPNSEIELRNICGRYTMDVIASAAFGVESKIFEDENSPFGVNGRKFQDSFGKSLLFKFALMILFPGLCKYLKLSIFNAEALNFLESVVRENIRRRKELGEKRNDFLQLMIETQEEDESGDANNQEDLIMSQYDKDAQLDSKKVNKIKISDDLLIAQCNLFFIAGFDTTESLLMWSSYELAIHPDVQDRLYNELISVTGGRKEELTYDVINKLEYLEMVISETLRKYPAAVRSERKCNKDYEIPGGDYVIKKGTHVIVPTYGIHHDPEFYPDPETFDPERFNAENKANRHPYAYLPFGLGPRNCIAMRFALMEGKAAIAHLVLNFKLSKGKQTLVPMQYLSSGVMKPKNGMWLVVEPRN